MNVSYEELWCQCQGNANATPHMLLIQEQVARMHEVAQTHALWYVAVVVTLYLFGFTLIVTKSGSSERHTALEALYFCCSQTTSSLSSRRSNRT